MVPLALMLFSGDTYNWVEIYIILCFTYRRIFNTEFTVKEMIPRQTILLNSAYFYGSFKVLDESAR